MERLRCIKRREIMTANLTPDSHISQSQAVVAFRDFEHATVATGGTYCFRPCIF